MFLFFFNLKQFIGKRSNSAFVCVVLKTNSSEIIQQMLHFENILLIRVNKPVFKVGKKYCFILLLRHLKSSLLRYMVASRRCGDGYKSLYAL